MRKNFGEPKNFVDFEDLLEDEKFRKLWDNDHSDVVATQCDANNEDNEYEVCKDPSSIAISTATSSTAPTTSSINKFHSTRQYVVLNQQTRKKYGKGENMIEKMGYLGGGGLGITSQGN